MRTTQNGTALTQGRRLRTLTVTLGIAIAAVFGVASPASAETVECVGVLTGPIDANVVVPPGAACTLQAAVVDGNVLVDAAASLRANDSLIDGNVVGRNSRFVILQFETEVTGNLHVRGGASGTVSGFDINTRVGGNAMIEFNRGRTFVDAANVGGNLEIYNNTGFLEIEFNQVGGFVNVMTNAPIGMSNLFNQVGGDMIVSNNTGPGAKFVVSNTIGKKLICQNNDPPFVGQPNVAQDYQGECGP